MFFGDRTGHVNLAANVSQRTLGALSSSNGVTEGLDKLLADTKNICKCDVI